MINEGEMAMIEYQSLPSATYAKFKPMSTDFLNISNPRAMLEVELRKFACLTKGDVIAVEVFFDRVSLICIIPPITVIFSTTSKSSSSR